MPGSLGGLVVTLGLDAGEYFKGLTKAEQDLKKFSDSIGRSLGQNGLIGTGASVAAAGIAAISAAAVTAFIAIDQLVKQAGKFQDLSEKTGATAESLAAFSIAAHVAETSIDDVANFSIKLSKNLAAAEDASTKAGAALVALGIDIEKFKSLDPASQLEALAKAQANFGEGSGKTSAFEALAKGGAQLLPFLKELNAEGGRNAILTREQIVLADDYADRQARLKETLHQYAQVAAISALPAINSLTEVFAELIRRIVGVDEKQASLAANNWIEKWAERGATTLAFLADAAQGVSVAFQVAGVTIAAGVAQVDAAATGKGLTGIKEVSLAWREQVKEILNVESAQNLLEKSRARARAAANFVGPQQSASDKPQVKFNGADKPDANAGVAKAQLDQALKLEEDFIKSEQDLFRTRSQVLNAYFQDDSIGFEAYFAARGAALNDAIQKQQDAYDREIGLLVDFGSRKGIKQQEQIETETKINALLAKKSKLEQDGLEQTLFLTFESARAYNQLRDSIEQTAIALADLQGDTVTAGLAGFDFANRKLQTAINNLKESSDPERRGLGNAGQATLDQTRALLQVRLSLDAATRGYNSTLDLLGITQERINIAESAGALTSLGALRARSDLAAAYVPILKEQLAALDAIANKSPEQLLAVEKLRLQMEQLAATGDLVAKKFNEIGASAFSNFLTDVVSGTKTLKQAFLDMAKSIEQSISKIAADELAQRLFKQGGALGGFGDFFSQIFGGKAGSSGAGEGAAGAAQLLAAGSTLSLSGTALIEAAAALNVSAAALSAGAATSAIGSAGGAFGDVLGSLFGGGLPFPGFAGGTSNAPGGLAWVGEHGRELMRVPRGAQIIPNDQSNAMMGSSINQTLVIPANVDSRSIRQIRKAAYEGVVRGMRDK
jgi:hypothetical protein